MSGGTSPSSEVAEQQTSREDEQMRGTREQDGDESMEEECRNLAVPRIDGPAGDDNVV